MKRKGILILLLTLILSVCCFGLVACGKDKEQDGEIKTETVSVSVSVEGNLGGVISSDAIDGKVNKGSSLKITVTPLNGYVVEYFKVNGEDKTASLSGGVYQINSVESDITAIVKFTEDEDDITNREQITVNNDFNSTFFSADNWQTMTTTQSGITKTDEGEKPYSLADGSIKFFNANQAISCPTDENHHISFMVNATEDWSFWFLSDGIDNQTSHNFRLKYQGKRLFITTSAANDASVAVADSKCGYVENEWNRIDIVYSVYSDYYTVKLFVNTYKAKLQSGNVTANAEIEDGNLLYKKPASMTLGNYYIFKTWGGNNVLRVKPVDNANEGNTVTKVACVGDSITAGAGADSYWHESYPVQLQKRLGDRYSVVNFGNSGKTLRSDLNDSYRRTDEYKGLLLYKPDVVIIMIGTNDSKTENVPLTTQSTFERELKAFVNEIKAVAPNVRVIIGTSPTAYGDRYTISDDNITNIINPAQRAVATEMNLELFDMNAYTKNKSLLFPDTIHPSTKGYELFSKLYSYAVKGESVPSGLADEYNDPDISDKELDSKGIMPVSFFTATGWEQMANDGGDPATVYDGGVKFQWSNISTNVGYAAESHLTFNLKSNATGSQGFSLRFRADSNDNQATDYYALCYQYDYLYIQKAGIGDWLTKSLNSGYVENAWNRIDIIITESQTATEIKVYVNEKKVIFEENYHVEGITYDLGTITDTNKFATEGEWFAVKTWGPVVILRDVDYEEESVIKVACVGDSITYSQGASAGNSYPEQLQNMLGANYSVSNFGFPGAAILPQSELQSWTYSYWDLQNYTDSLLYDADIVIIMFGANDGHYLNWGTGTEKQALFKAKYEALIDSYRAVNSDVKILIALPTKTYDINPSDPNSMHYTARGVQIENYVNPVIEEIATEKDCTLVDLLTPTSNHQELSADGVHWTDLGYTIIAETFYNAVIGLA